MANNVQIMDHDEAVRWMARFISLQPLNCPLKPQMDWINAIIDAVESKWTADLQRGPWAGVQCLYRDGIRFSGRSSGAGSFTRRRYVIVCCPGLRKNLSRNSECSCEYRLFPLSTRLIRKNIIIDCWRVKRKGKSRSLPENRLISKRILPACLPSSGK